MSLIYNGVEIDEVIFNGTEIDSIILNGTEIFSGKLDYIYDRNRAPVWNPKVNAVNQGGFSGNPMYSRVSYGNSRTLSFQIKKTSKLKRIDVVCSANAFVNQGAGNARARGLIRLSSNGVYVEKSGYGSVTWGGTSDWHDNIVNNWSWSGTLSLDVSNFANGTYTISYLHICDSNSHNYGDSDSYIYSITPVYI